jgi:serine/threonine protein kinase
MVDMLSRLFGQRKSLDAGAPRGTHVPEHRRYQVGEVIGGTYAVQRVFEGGLGVVYVVEHPEAGKLVLKTIKSGLCTPEAFLREAEAWVSLGSHQHIVAALWVDEVAGLLFVAAELVQADEGGRLSLRDYLRAGPLTPRQAVRFSTQFCYGLAHAVSRGLISHRDIKPENLLIGATGDLRITDFGIAAARTGGVVAAPSSGTPPYMAPEQIVASHDQDERVDIYAFGVVLCEMIHGRMPFAGRSAEEFVRNHLYTEPLVPPGPFSVVIKRCLAKRPSDRHLNSHELREDIRRVASDLGIGHPPPPAPVDRTVEELRAQAHSLAAMGRHAEAIQSTTHLTELAPYDSSNWTQLGRLLLESGDLSGAVAATERSLAIDDSRSPPWNNLGVILTRQGRWDYAASAFARALECDPYNTGALLNASKPLVSLGRFQEATDFLRRACSIAPDKFSVWTNLASTYSLAGDDQNALECYVRARQLAPERYHAQLDDCIRQAGGMVQ